MRIARQTDHELVIEESSLWLSVVLFVAATALAFLTLSQNKPKGLLGAGLFFLFALMWVRKIVFRFDAGEQMVYWMGRVLFKVTTGNIPFSQITGIGTETSSGGKSGNVPTYRLSILTAVGSTPMSSAYGGNRNNYMSIREVVLRFLHLDASDASALRANLGVDEASVRSLLRQGRRVDAISLVQTGAKIGLTESVERVEEIDKAMMEAK